MRPVGDGAKRTMGCGMSDLRFMEPWQCPPGRELVQRARPSRIPDLLESRSCDFQQISDANSGSRRMPWPVSAKNRILAREHDNGDGVYGGLVLPASDLLQSYQSWDHGNPGTAAIDAASLGPRGAGCFHRPAPLRSR